MGDRRTIADLPDAVEHADEISRRLAGREPVVFLDYDGTLTRIVAEPEDATLSEATRAIIERLARRCTVAVVSGRDLDDVRAMVDIDGIHYAGSHGFDILTPDGESIQRGRGYLPSLDAAEEELTRQLAGLAGARVERKRFAIAVHFRAVDEAAVPAVERAVDDVLETHGDLRRTSGKRIYELRPDLDWDKGKALSFLLRTLGLDRGDVVPLYLGDDVTDEDAFRAVADEGGLGLVVRGEDDDRVTAAEYSFADPDRVRAFLGELVASVEDGA